MRMIENILLKLLLQRIPNIFRFQADKGEKKSHISNFWINFFSFFMSDIQNQKKPNPFLWKNLCQIYDLFLFLCMYVLTQLISGLW